MVHSASHTKAVVTEEDRRQLTTLDFVLDDGDDQPPQESNLTTLKRTLREQRSRLSIKERALEVARMKVDEARKNAAHDDLEDKEDDGHINAVLYFRIG